MCCFRWSSISLALDRKFHMPTKYLRHKVSCSPRKFIFRESRIPEDATWFSQCFAAQNYWAAIKKHYIWKTRKPFIIFPSSYMKPSQWYEHLIQFSPLKKMKVPLKFIDLGGVEGKLRCKILKSMPKFCAIFWKPTCSYDPI